MAANYYGPSLPSDMLEQEPDKGISVTRESTARVYGPSLPPDLLIGERSDEIDKKEKVSRIGVDTRPVIGPSLPPDLSLDQKETDTLSSRLPSSLVSVQESGENDRFIGPCIPSTSQPNSKPALEEVKEDVDVSVIGPKLPAGIDQEGSSIDLIKASIESRAKRMQGKLTAKDEEHKPARDEWMVELPPEFRIAGMGPRKFRTENPVIGDRSIWTDTPADRERKKAEMEKTGKTPSTTSAPVVMSQRDKEMEEIVSSYNKAHRSETLVDMHQRKRKVVGGSEERRPFDRERDLEIQHILPSGKRRDMMQQSSRDLKSKFSHSTREKFL